MSPAIPQADAATNDSATVGVLTALSDLFFNHDNDSARVLDQGEFVGWDEDKLREEAATVLQCLLVLGLHNLPAPDELVADFLSRC